MSGCLDGDGDVTLETGGLVDAVRAGAIGAVASGLPGPPIRGEIEDQRLDEMDRGLHLPQVDVLAEPGAATFEDGGGERGHSVARGDEIGVGAPGAGRWAIGPSGEPVQPGERRTLSAESAVRRVRAGLAAEAGAEHHEVRAASGQRRVPQAETIEHAGDETLDEHVSPIDQSFG